MFGFFKAGFIKTQAYLAEVVRSEQAKRAKRTRRRRRRVVPWTLLASIMLVPLAVRGQSLELKSSEIALERFRLSSDRGGLLDVEWADVGAPRTWGAALWFGYEKNPFLQPNLDDLGIVTERISGDLQGAYTVNDRIQLGVVLPIIASQSQDAAAELLGDNEFTSFGTGDVRIVPKIVLYKGAISLAFLPVFTMPTASGNDFLGEIDPLLAPELAVSTAQGPLRISLNGGYRMRTKTRVAELKPEDELFGRAGVGVRFGKAEVDVTTSLASSITHLGKSKILNHWESAVGAQFDATAELSIFALGGLGHLEGYGTPDWRGLAGVRWQRTNTLPPKEEKPTDKDSDGVADADDKCPDEAETMNQVDDTDGCPDEVPPAPEPDDDNDGIKGEADKCPTEAEDTDSFQDEDGCPDPDNDADSLLDAGDKCPTEAGPVENAGCPDTDKDGDTVFDRLDNCPEEAGKPENQGCVAVQKVVITAEKLQILDKVFFTSGKDTIEKRSFALLDNIAQVLTAHPEIAKLMIEGHTDDVGNDAKNLELSQRRATSVVTYLVGKGVDATRLEAVGHGETKPLDPAKTAKARAENRRVEFNIVK